MSKSQAKRIRVQKGLPMGEPTVEEVREALVWFAQATDTELSDDSNEPKLNAVEFAAQKWVDAAEPDIEAAEDAFKIEWFGTPKDFASKLMDSQPDPEVERAVGAAIAAAFGDKADGTPNNLIRRAE